MFERVLPRSTVHSNFIHTKQETLRKKLYDITKTKKTSCGESKQANVSQNDSLCRLGFMVPRNRTETHNGPQIELVRSVSNKNDDLQPHDVLGIGGSCNHRTALYATVNDVALVVSPELMHKQGVFHEEKDYEFIEDSELDEYVHI